MTFIGGQSAGYFLKLWPYKLFMEWSSAFWAGSGVGFDWGTEELSLGTGVVLRVVHGFIDSTALAKYDFSSFFSDLFSSFLSPGVTVLSGPVGIVSNRPGAN
ncbi:hypothetical protein RRF57_004303 [Xylaria bambusicola]|uniref:Uncharacterized protein n=1 Tax=Xylaria bambusicola TaxID=326684 RepID=A0AAN7UHM1_9PEZI